MSGYFDALSAAEAFYQYLEATSNLNVVLDVSYVEDTIFAEFCEARMRENKPTPRFSSLMYFLKLNRIPIVNFKERKRSIRFRAKRTVSNTEAVVHCSAAERNRSKREQRKRREGVDGRVADSNVEVTPVAPAVISSPSKNKHFFQTINLGDTVESLNMTIKIKNTSSVTVKVGACQLMAAKNFKTSLSKGSMTLKQGEECFYNISCKHFTKNIGLSINDLVVSTKADGAEKSVTQMYQVVFDIVDKFTKDLRPSDSARTTINRPVAVTSIPRGRVIPGFRPIRLQTDKLEKKIRLGEYPVTQNIRDALMVGAFAEENPGNDFKKLRRQAEEELNLKNYSVKFQLLLQLEEMQCNYDILRYSMSGVSMKKRGRLMFLKVAGLAEKRPSVLRGDRIYVTRQRDEDSTSKDEFEGYVHVIELDQIGVGFSEKLFNAALENERYDVRFTFNRLCIRLSHRAVDTKILKQIRFPNKSAVLYHDIEIKKSDLKNKLIQSNPEQRQAILNIVRGKTDPVPYIVYGPPGTGKTVTLVEGICQVIEKYEGCTVLVCAPSNSACDHLTKLLLDHIRPDTVFRMHAASRLWSQVPEEIRGVSNYRNGDYYYPPKKEFDDYDIIVCTLLTAGRLASAGFEKDYFTHVFIDEAGQATEPECMVAISGSLSHTGQLVLAGDPQQLGPVVSSAVSKRYGLGLSYLERLMSTCQIYQRNEKSLKYDNKYITKLLKNYRSHQAILRVPNECFYDNELLYEVKMTKSMELVCKWSELPQLGFPVIFEGVCGLDTRENNSPSFFNPHEVTVLLQYVESTIKLGFSGKSIGIISPYRKQVEKIRRNLHHRDIKVGTVEEFQGQERDIIIISTVRSNVDYLSFDIQHNLGFLSDAKRFNVAVTRAKCLLVVIGNPNILSLDYYWKSFLEYCIAENAYRGIDYQAPDARKAEIENVLSMMDNLSVES